MEGRNTPSIKKTRSSEEEKLATSNNSPYVPLGNNDRPFKKPKINRTKAEKEQILEEALEKVTTTQFKTKKELFDQLSLKYQDLTYDVFIKWLKKHPIGRSIRESFSSKGINHDPESITKKAKELAPFVRSFTELVKQLQSEYPNISRYTFRRHLEKIFPETKDKGAEILLRKLIVEDLPQSFNNEVNEAEEEQAFNPGNLLDIPQPFLNLLTENVSQSFNKDENTAEVEQLSEGKQPFNPGNLSNIPQPFLNLLGVVNNNNQVNNAEVERFSEEEEQAFNPGNLSNIPQPFLDFIGPLNNTLRTGRQHIAARHATTPQQSSTYTGNPFSIFAPPRNDSPSWMDPLASYSPLARSHQDNRFAYATQHPTHNTKSGLPNHSYVSSQPLPRIEQAIDELFQHLLTSNDVAKFIELKSRIIDALQNGGYDPRIGAYVLKNSLRQGMQNLTIQQLDQFEQNFRLLDTQHLGKNDLSFMEVLNSIFNETNLQRNMQLQQKQLF